MTADEAMHEAGKMFIPASYAAALRCLEQNDMTEDQLTKATKTARSTIHRALIKLRQAKVIHIYDWVPSEGKGPWVRLYRLGPGKDKAKPRKMTAAQVVREYRAAVQVANAQDISFAGLFGATR